MCIVLEEQRDWFFCEDHESFKMKYKRNGREETTESMKRTDLTDVLLKPFFLYEERTVRAQMQERSDDHVFAVCLNVARIQACPNPITLQQCIV